MRSVSKSVLASALTLGMVTGCPSREVAEISPAPAKEVEKEIAVSLNRDIDILFVIDNSGSMAEEQASLVQNFPRFINVLKTIEGGLPNVHIGVVSSDVGAGPYTIPGCSGNGDNGTLQNTARGNCDPPSGAFISDIEDGMGGRIQNYSGTLEETFTCIARLGTAGCGFEQHLEAMRRALNGSNPANAGFLRKEAFLAVIFVADEDDCSATDTRMFDPSQMSIDSELGPLASYRCTEFGVECMPDSRTQVGPRSDCKPRQNSPFMPHPQEYVDFLKGLKDDPLLLITAGILGNPTPFAIGQNASTGNPELLPSCSSAAGNADPAVRLKHFLDQFPSRNTFTTICNEDLSDAMQQIADLLAAALGTPCLDEGIKLTDGRPSCTGEDVLHPRTDREERTFVPECSSPSSAAAEAPCWYVEQDPATCTTSHQLSLVIERGGAEPPLGTFFELRCEAL
jgi:hypothetical protein